MRRRDLRSSAGVRPSFATEGSFVSSKALGARWGGGGGPPGGRGGAGGLPLGGGGGGRARPDMGGVVWVWGLDWI